LKTIFIISIIIFFLKSYGQEIKKENEKLFYIDTICKIISDNPDCFNVDIPLKYRTNTKDTIKFSFTDYNTKKNFLFYKGKCDTNCYVDTTVLYFKCKNLYALDSLEEYLYISWISKAFKTINEPNLSINSDTNLTIVRLSLFKDTLPIIYRIENKSEKTIIYKKVCSGNVYFIDSIVFNTFIQIKTKTWKKIFMDFSTFLSWVPKEKFINDLPNVLIELKTKSDYSFLYLNDYECNMSRKTRIKFKMN